MNCQDSLQLHTLTMKIHATWWLESERYFVGLSHTCGVASSTQIGVKPIEVVGGSEKKIYSTIIYIYIFEGINQKLLWSNFGGHDF